MNTYRNTYFGRAQSSFFARLTSILLVFLFIFSPLATFAQEADAVPAQGDKAEIESKTENQPDQIDEKDPVDLQAPENADDEKDVITDSVKEIADENLDDIKPIDPEEDPEQNSLTTGGDQEPSDDITKSKKSSLLETDPRSGALTYAYPITVPPGRNGMQPDVQLEYNSQGNNIDSVLSYGWSINNPYIERINKKGTGTLYTEKAFSSSLDAELVEISTGSYGPKVENGSFNKYVFSSNTWTVTDKTGTVYTFGSSAASRQDNPSDSSKIYKWMLEKVEDTNGNFITYTYNKNGGQIYPSTITYTNRSSGSGIFEVEFLRETRPDVSTNHRPMFPVVNNYRINEIQVKISGAWVRKYVIAYTSGDNGNRKLVSSITETGKDESGTTISLPATSFTYQYPSTNLTSSSDYVAPVFFSNYNYNDDGARLADVNGDGFVDIIQSKLTNTFPTPTHVQGVYINDGHGSWALDTNWSVPMPFLTPSPVRDTGVRIADVNGDGIPDLLYAGYDNSSTKQTKVYIGNGATGWSLDTNWSFPVDTVRGTSQDVLFIESSTYRGDNGVRVADVNGDGLADLVRSAQRYGSPYYISEYAVYLNNGDNTGWTKDTSWTFPTNYTFPDSSEKKVFFTSYNLKDDEGVRISDVNGDGLPDLVQSGYVNSTAESKIYMNTGKGWELDTAWDLPTGTQAGSSQKMKFVETNAKDKGLRIADLNGDGLPDLIHSMQLWGGSHEYSIYINNGETGWDLNTNWDVPSPFVENTNIDLGVVIEDVNGDGMADVIRSKEGPTNVKYTYLNDSHQPDVLSTITNSEGAVSTVTYKMSALYLDGSNNILNPTQKISVPTVYQISTTTGYDNATMVDTYTYEGGSYYYNTPLDRRLAGFAKITTTDAAGFKTVNYYHQGNSSNTSTGEYSDHIAKAGRVYRTEVYDNSGNLYQKTINKWDRYNLGTGRDFVKKIRTVAFSYDGDSDHKELAEEYSYDNTYGNVTSKITWGEVTGADDGTFTDTGSDKYTESISYVANTGNYVVGLPYQSTVNDQYSTKIRESKIYYDGNSLGTVGIGNQTKIEKWKSSSTYVSTEKDYDGTYGLVVASRDERGMETTYSYDTYNLYPDDVTNPLSQTTSYTYDYSIGKPKQTTDPNTRVYQKVYDALDRVIAIKQPDLATPSTLVTKTAYTYTAQSIGTKIQKTDYLDGSTSVDTYTYTDGFNRPVQTRAETETSNSYATTDTVYNLVNQVGFQSLPYASTGTSKTSATGTTALLTTYTYDPMMRVLTAVNAVGTTSSVYDDWKTTTTDPRSKVKNYYKDAYDNLIKVDEINGGSTYTTNYEYNGNNNLTKITDALSNVRNFTYDGLGRRLTAQDLHASADSYYGTWTYTYDDAGNIATTVDPNGATITYAYDDINRVLSEDSDTLAGTEIEYEYDNGTDSIGHLTYAITSDGVISGYAHNPNGLVESETTTIQGTDYMTQYTYDRQGNQLVIVNPDDSETKYTYNTAGKLEMVQKRESGGSFVNVVSNFDYGPHGKVTTQAFQNGASTTNTYDASAMYRMSSKVTTITGGTKIQDIAYTYDANGNITGITDNSQTNAKKTMAYVYDDLNRLTSATSSSMASGVPAYTETYTYDAIGNLSTKSDQGTYSYAGNTSTLKANPHAATTIGSTALTYDNNGNMLTGPAGTGATWYSNGGTWTNRKQITIDHTKVSGSTALTNFPVLISLTDATLKTTANGGNVGKSDGTDIVFTASDGVTKLSYELEKYVATTGQIVAWVKVPSLSPTVDTTLLIYYGNSGASDQQDKNNVWDSNTKAVLHLNNSLSDSTSNANNGTNYSSSNTTSGKIGDGRDFTGASDRVTLANASSIKPTAQLTFSGWFKRNGAQPDYAKPFWFGQTASSPWGPYGIQFDASSDTATVGHVASSTTAYWPYANTTSLSNTTWYYLAVTYDGTNIRYYINDVLQDTVAASITIANYDGTNGYGIGDSYGGGQGINGYIDEVHISSTARSTDWLKTEYNNQNSPSTFATIGTYTAPTLTNTWTYDNKLAQSVIGGVTIVYSYDYVGNRIRLYNGTTNTHYPSKYYNANGTTETKNIFTPSGEMVGTVTTISGASVLYSNHTDHLTGSNVVTNSGGTVEELMDYYPFGSVRLDQKANSFSTQRKYTGHEYDADNGLNYMNARYQNGKTGQFISQDAVFLAIGDEKKIKDLSGQNLMKLLSNPQQLNSYSYSVNNPIAYIDINGNISFYVLGYFTSEQKELEIGQSVDYLYNNNQTWKAAIDHPVEASIAVGVVGAAAAVTAVAGVAGIATMEAGVSTAYVGKMATGSVLYGYVARNALKSLPDVVKAYSRFDIQNNKTWKSPIAETAKMYVPGALGEHIGAGYDIFDSAVNLVKDFTNAKQSNQIKSNSSNK